VNLSAGKINTSECVCFFVVKPMERSFLETDDYSVRQGFFQNL